MAVNATAVWRVRIGGSDLNGGGFDASIAGAGADYSDQDTAQLTITDLATSGISANVTSATGGFTSAMIGNAIWIASGTNFTAGVYFITAVASTNAATVDRNCCTAAASGGQARVGGAQASPIRATGVVAGNILMIRGQGSNDPVDVDYFLSTNWNNPPNGLTVVGYNGRPKIGHIGRMFSGSVYNMALKNLSFIQTGATYTTQGIVGNTASSSFAENCVFDQGGFDSTQLLNCSATKCSVINTGSQVVGTVPALQSTGATASVLWDRVHVKDVRGVGAALDPRTVLVNSIIQNCGSDGVQVTATGLGANYFSGVSLMNNTIHGNGGHGININNALTLVSDNLITGHTGSGKYGLYYSADPGNYGRNLTRVARNNFYGNTTDSNYALSLMDTTVDPQYVNAPTDLTPQNTALRYLSGVGSL